MCEPLRLKRLLLRPALLALATATTAALAVTLLPSRSIPVGGGAATSLLWLSDSELLSAADTRVVMVDVSGSVKRTFRGASDQIETVLISPDQRWVAATTSFGNEIVVWDASTAKVIGRLTGEYISAGFVSGGQLLVETWGKLILWNPQSGQRQIFPNPLRDDLNEVVTSVDGQRVALRGEDRVVVLDAAGTVLRDVRSPGASSVRFSADHSWMAVTGEEDAFAVQLATGRILRVPDSDFPGQVTFLESGGLILLGYGTLRGLDLDSGETKTFSGSPSSGTVLALDANSKGDLAIGTYSGVWTGTETTSGLVQIPAASVYTLGWLSGQFVTVGPDHRLIDEQGRAVSPEIRRVGDVASTGTALWISTRTSVGQVSGGKLNVLTTLPDADALDDKLNLTEGGASAVLVRDRKLTIITPGKAIMSPKLEKLSGEPLADGALTADGRTLNVFQRNAALSEYTMATGKLRTVVDLPGQGLQLAVSRGGSRAALHVNQGKYTLSLLPPGAMKPTRSLILPGNDMASDLSLRFSPDGKRLAVINEGRNVWLLDTATLGILAKFGPLADTTQTLAWSADGTQLAVGAGGPDDSGAITVLNVK